MGNLSHTFNKVSFGIVSAGKWIGEEPVILNGQLPQLYTATCVTEVKAYQLNVTDYQIRFPQDTKTEMETLTFQKLYELREKFRQQNELKYKIEKMDVNTKNLPNTVQHFKKVYGHANLHMQKKLIKNYN